MGNGHGGLGNPQSPIPKTLSFCENITLKGENLREYYLLLDTS